MPASSFDSEFREGVIRVVPETDGIVAVCLDGDFDLADAPALSDQISEELDNGTGLIIDLTDATFIDSTVIQVLLQAVRAAAEHRKPVVLQLGTPSEVERTIKIVGIERVLPRAHEREDAVAMIRQHRDADRAASGAPRMRGGGENAAARSALTYVNTSIFEAAAESIAQEATWDFFCECGDPACNERAALTLNRYEQLRDAGEAILAPGHHVDENARARALRADAQALRAQARHQVRRAGKKLDDPGLRS